MRNYEIQRTFYNEPGVDSLLYEPVCEKNRKGIGIMLMHSDANYLTFSPAPELAKRGCSVLASVPVSGGLDRKIEALSKAVEWLKNTAGINKVILLGHSGGATLMSAYQAAAENGPDYLSRESLIYPVKNAKAFAPADGIILLDSNWGNGMMTLLSTDPSVYYDGKKWVRDEELSLFNPKNGFSENGAAYTDEFLVKYFAAQRKRYMGIVEYARERLAVLENGEGQFSDDEPLVQAAASQVGPCNLLFPQDIRLFAHTERPHVLLHKKGAETFEVVKSLRKPRGSDAMGFTYGMGAMSTTVKSFLASQAVRVGEDYRIDATSVYGIDWDSCFCCTPANVPYIKTPALVMGMSGGYESMAAELIYDRCKSADKTLAYVEGATHNFTPNKQAEETEGQFGNTIETLFDYVDRWIEERS